MPLRKPFSWKCPYCNKHATVTDSNYWEGHGGLLVDTAFGQQRMMWWFIICPNSDCKKFTLDVRLVPIKSNSTGNLVQTGGPIYEWSLLPRSKASSFPDYIPHPIIQDYEEACLILNDSPKASATLARRCLQGIIRDYWGVSGRTLWHETEAIKDKVDPSTWEAIDAIRTIGNIGAHMEKDINLIVDVDPSEAELLVELIETLITDWYVARHERKERLRKIVELRDKKAAERKQKANNEEAGKDEDTPAGGDTLLS